jgi:acetolactate synthase-1/2/3 large subunit
MIDLKSHVYPMIGPGMGYKDMITGKYIPSRDPSGGGKPGGGEEPPGYF